MDSVYKSGLDRLQDLPEFFSLNTFTRHADTSRDSAKVMLSRWSAKNWIQPTGPRSGTYFNTLVYPKSPDTHKLTAILYEYPSAILIGESILHSAGWITQIPSELTIAVESRRSYSRLNGVALSGRTLSWYRAMNGVGAIHKNGTNDINAYGLRFIDPAWALADMYLSEESWHPDPDDLDIPDDQFDSFVLACKAMGSKPFWLESECISHRF